MCASVYRPNGSFRCARINRSENYIAYSEAPDGSEHKIEFLGDGQQYDVAGIHPKTGKPYAWYGGKLTDIRRENLPYTEHERADQFLNVATKLLTEEFGFTLISEDAAATNGGGELHEENEEPQASPARVAAALEVIPNDVDWDEWNRVGMAMWRATGGTKAGFVAFDKWSQKSPKYN